MEETGEGAQPQIVKVQCGRSREQAWVPRVNLHRCLNASIAFVIEGVNLSEAHEETVVRNKLAGELSIPQSNIKVLLRNGSVKVDAAAILPHCTFTI